MNVPPRWVLPTTEEMKAKAESFDQTIWENLSVDPSLIEETNLVPPPGMYISNTDAMEYVKRKPSDITP